MIKQSKELINDIFLIAVIALMVGLSEATGQKEIIFPEIAAMSIGCFLAPALVWQMNYPRMFLGVLFCAASGVFIVRFIPAPLAVQVVLAYIVGLLILNLTGTSFVPMISAIALPVLLGADSIIYILSAAGLTLIVIGLRLVLEGTGNRSREVYRPLVLRKGLISQDLFRIIFVAVISAAVLSFDFRFAVAPPLLVAFTEMTGGYSDVLRRIRIVGLVTLCAILGSILRLAMPLTLAAAFAGTGIIILVKIFQLPYPPAGAMAVLALLIPEGMVIIYPLQVFIGISILAAASECYVRIIEKRKEAQS